MTRPGGELTTYRVTGRFRYMHFAHEVFKLLHTNVRDDHSCTVYNLKKIRIVVKFVHQENGNKYLYFDIFTK